MFFLPSTFASGSALPALLDFVTTRRLLIPGVFIPPNHRTRSQFSAYSTDQNFYEINLLVCGAASSLLADGATPAVVQKQLRHSDLRITLGVYAQVIGNQRRDAVEARSARIEQFAVSWLNWREMPNQREMHKQELWNE